MKKSTAITIIVALSALLVFSFVPRMVQYFAPVPEVSDTTSVSDSTSEETSEPTYTRVEAEKYVFTRSSNPNSVYKIRIKVKFDNISSEKVFDFSNNGLQEYTFAIASTGYIHLNAFSAANAPSFPDAYSDYLVEDFGSYKLASEITGEEESLPIVRSPVYEYVLVE